ncbi:UDP-N-acetylmuramate dehydrogenase [Pedobacter montanisoli]|uniref:UDP-N-acetylenolpyruvoylglucosamine reductase n=1 Tax=Pedobacter montanisoli TaxID=2923277 RepID=A0ABS9ZVF3_9SPHI|nr:UDP-N-acetylmuramate dehydrogenase [Pedobacter montanisoli]MCJ0742208.1 UDP-N-acetylmuramate dehydrogenase [Pedobacter montanisoli]
MLIKQEISLKPYNTFGIDVKAKYFAEIKNEQDLEELFMSREAKEEKLLILGGGSNMLFTQDFKGLVVKMAIEGISYALNGNVVELIAGAGVVWNDLVMFCVTNNFAGLENLTLIPGTVGASPIQNIGAYGVELKDAFKQCRVFEIATGRFLTFSYEDCKFGYRDSVFKNEYKGKYIVTSVTFNLSTEAHLKTHYGAINAELEAQQITKPTIADVSKVVAKIRVSKLPDPTTIGNAGSFFKNPVISKTQFNQLIVNFPDVVHFDVPDDQVKIAAGWLIEQCGFKGITDGHTGTWKNQALVLVNHGNATGQEVYNFSEKIITEVYTKFGVCLEREVNVF